MSGGAGLLRSEAAGFGGGSCFISRCSLGLLGALLQRLRILAAAATGIRLREGQRPAQDLVEELVVGAGR